MAVSYTHLDVYKRQVLLSRELPPDVTHLAQILRNGVTSGMIDPFHCRIKMCIRDRLYTLSCYRLVCVYTRAAVGE